MSVATQIGLFDALPVAPAKARSKISRKESHDEPLRAQTAEPSAATAGDNNQVAQLKPNVVEHDTRAIAQDEHGVQTGHAGKTCNQAGPPAFEAPPAVEHVSAPAALTVVSAEPRSAYLDAFVALMHLVGALQSTGSHHHEAGSHVRRAAVLVRGGDPGRAALYLRTLAQNALRQRRSLRSRGAALANELAISERGERAGHYWSALRTILRAGAATVWLPRVAIASAVPLVETWPLPAGQKGGTVGGYSREVQNPCWPALPGCVHVSIDERERRGWWVELYVGFPDEARSQLVIHRGTETREAAASLAQQLAELGEAVIAATVTRGVSNAV